MKRVTRHTVLRRDVEYGRTTVHCSCGWRSAPCLCDTDVAREIGRHEIAAARERKRGKR